MDENPRVSSGRMTYPVTRDGQKHEFATPEEAAAFIEKISPGSSANYLKMAKARESGLIPPDALAYLDRGEVRYIARDEVDLGLLREFDCCRIRYGGKERVFTSNADLRAFLDANWPMMYGEILISLKMRSDPRRDPSVHKVEAVIGGQRYAFNSEAEMDAFLEKKFGGKVVRGGPSEQRLGERAEFKLSDDKGELVNVLLVRLSLPPQLPADVYFREMDALESRLNISGELSESDAKGILALDGVADSASVSCLLARFGEVPGVSVKSSFLGLSGKKFIRRLA